MPSFPTWESDRPQTIRRIYLFIYLFERFSLCKRVSERECTGVRGEVEGEGEADAPAVQGAQVGEFNNEAILY